MSCITPLDAAPPSERHILVRIEVSNAVEIQDLVSEGLDLLQIAPQRDHVFVRVSQEELDSLVERGRSAEVLEENIYDREQQVTGGVATGDWKQYNNLASANQFMLDLVDAYPDRAALFTLGESWEQRPIYGLRISDDASNADETEPAFFIIGCHHAREWISAEIPLFIAERLVTDYDTDEGIRSLVDRAEIWIVPILNVDGYAFSQFDRWWRKNRRVNDDNSYGVDLNRNYSYAWGQLGASSIPYQETYRGPSAFSEPESQAVADLFAARRFQGSLTYHNYSQYVATPWGFTKVAPPHEVVLSTLALNMASRINAAHTRSIYDYTPGQWSILLYLGSGVFVDWAYGDHNMPSILVEVRPAGDPFFLLPENEILPTCEENYAGALEMMESVIGSPTDPPGDFNDNAFVDLMDHQFFTECMSGPTGTIPAFPLGCYAADFDGDGRVTLADAQLFVNGF